MNSNKYLRRWISRRVDRMELLTQIVSFFIADFFFLLHSKFNMQFLFENFVFFYIYAGQNLEKEVITLLIRSGSAH